MDLRNDLPSANWSECIVSEYATFVNGNVVVCEIVLFLY